MHKNILKIVLIIVVSLSLLAPLPNIFADMDASVSVPPRISDLQLLTSLNPDNSTYAQNEEFAVQITYGSSLFFAAPMTIVAQWSQGTIQGQAYPSVDILDYVDGSASDAYGSTPPVIDTVNRTVTWTIPSFPAHVTGQALSFHLKTNYNYTASQSVSFTIGSYIADSGTTINATDITRSYQYNSSGPTPTPTPTEIPTPTSEPTATSTPEPTSTPVPTNIPTPTPTIIPTSTPTFTPTPGPTSTPSPSNNAAPTASPSPTPEAFAIKTVNIRAVSDTSVTVYLTTNQISKGKIAYGTSLYSLNQSVEDNSLDLEHTITFSGLLPDKKYFFRAITTNENGKTSVSDIYTVKTAIVSETPLIETNTFAAASQNIILIAPSTSATNNLVLDAQKTLVVPQSIIYDFRFSLANTQTLKSIKAVLRKKKTTLGANTSIIARLLNLNNQNNISQENPLDILPTDVSDINISQVGLTEIQPGIFIGKLISNLPIGEYELFAVIADTNGNIIETKLSDVKVVSRLTALSKDTKEPIENARVYLSFFNQSSKKYDPLVPTLISIVNPSFTDNKGESSIVLPQGEYRTLVSDLGYKDKTVDFTIGIGKTDGYPTVYLEKEGFNLLSTFIYYDRVIRDVYIYYTLQYFMALSQSLRFFNLINALSLALFVAITLFSFKAKTHIPLRRMFSYFVYHLRKLCRQKMSSFYFEGTVLDGETKRPISRVNIYLIDGETHQTIKQTTTNINGHFFFALGIHKNYEILAVKNGYEITPFIEALEETYSKKPIIILLKESEAKTNSFSVTLIKSTEAFIGYLFEFLLLFSFIFEILSIPYFGLGRTLPFLLISVFNLFLWVLHLKQKSQTQKVI